MEIGPWTKLASASGHLVALLAPVCFLLQGLGLSTVNLNKHMWLLPHEELH